MLELALIENLRREDLNPIERATAYRRLGDEFGMTQEEIAEVVGSSRPSIANTIRLLGAPERDPSRDQPGEDLARDTGGLSWPFRTGPRCSPLGKPSRSEASLSARPRS